MTSPAALSMFLCQMGIAWGSYLLMTGIPTYLDNIQHYEIKTVSKKKTFFCLKMSTFDSFFNYPPMLQNGFLSALPYICMWISSFFFGGLSDTLINRRYLSLPMARKCANIVGSFGPALGLIWLAWVGCDRVMAVVVLCISLSLNSAFYSGVTVRSYFLKKKKDISRVIVLSCNFFPCSKIPLIYHPTTQELSLAFQTHLLIFLGSSVHWLLG